MKKAAAVLFLILSCCTEILYAKELRNCTVSEVINPGYEKLYKFKFSENPKLILKQNQLEDFKIIIGALTYSVGEDPLVDIQQFNQPNKYFIFYDGILSETVQFKINNGHTTALLRAIIDETEELYEIANFSCDEQRRLRSN